MTIRDFVLSDENIYLAIYSVKSYVFNYKLLSKEDKELLNQLSDPFNEALICETIQEVKEIIKRVLTDDNVWFQTSVFFQPKAFDEVNNVYEYRPIHTAGLYELITMVSLLHSLIYEIPSKNADYQLKLSNYSRLIPSNFYGNRVSKKPERLFKRWSVQYKEYSKKASEYFKRFHETREYTYEIQLDLKDFFPSINPSIIYGILIDHIPVNLGDEENVKDLKTIIYKLLYCEVNNLKTEKARNKYYKSDLPEGKFTRGIAQGLPQSYFFGNICMTKIAKIYEGVYRGKAVYYVDDSYVYTNKKIIDEKDFRMQIESINKKIEEMSIKYAKDVKADKTTFPKDISEEMEYKIEVHKDKKSVYTNINEVKDGEIYLRNLSREASQIGTDIKGTYSEDEDETLLNKTSTLVKLIKNELNNSNNKGREGYCQKLERYYKFFKYREIKLRLLKEREITDSVFEILLSDVNNNENKYKALEKGISKNILFDKYKHDIWQVALSILIINTVYEEEHKSIKTYIDQIIKYDTEEELQDCSYITKEFEGYLKGDNLEYCENIYGTIEKMVRKKMIRYARLNSKVLKEEFEGTCLKRICRNSILSSLDICSNAYINMSKYVQRNSNRLERMFLNAVYSSIFKVNISDAVTLSSYDKKGITYGELRTLVYIRNQNCDIQEFLKWNLELFDDINCQYIDYTIFEVLDAFKKYIVTAGNVDNLIVIHKYTCDVWKNGAKHLYFYTLHNQEHATDLIKNVIKAVKTFSYIKIKSFDYYLLFLACYLHDISMVKIAAPEDFLMDQYNAERIVTEVEEKWKVSKFTKDTKEVIFAAYQEIDSFFEWKIRSNHAKVSAYDIRNRSELDFLEASVRELVADISEGHMQDTNDIYFIKGEAQSKLISYKNDKILLRIADLLDMSKQRVSKPILNHNMENMSAESAFHWVSHLLTQGYDLQANYKAVGEHRTINLGPGSIIEDITITVYVSLSQFSRYESKCCKYGRIDDVTISETGFEIMFPNDMEKCKSMNCNFLCRWFNTKNAYLIQEMQALQAYLNRVPREEKFYSTNIRVKVVVVNATDISDTQFEILENKIRN